MAGQSGDIITNPCVPGRRFRVVPAVAGTSCVLCLVDRERLVEWATEEREERDFNADFQSRWGMREALGWMLVEVEVEAPRPAVGAILRLGEALDHPGLWVGLLGDFGSRRYVVLVDRRLGMNSHPADTALPSGRTLEQWVEVLRDDGPPTPPIDLTPLRDCWADLTRSWGRALAIHHHSAAWNPRWSWRDRRMSWLRFLVHTTDGWRLATLVEMVGGMSTAINSCLDALIAADRANDDR